jgi:hypothetical protein
MSAIHSKLEAIGAVEREIREGGQRWAAEEILRLRAQTIRDEEHYQAAMAMSEKHRKNWVEAVKWLAAQTAQQAYPCSPHCAGYLREQAIREALKNSQSLLIGMMHEWAAKPKSEIEPQVLENRAALGSAATNKF